MPTRNWKLRIEDILSSIEKIKKSTADLKDEEFLLDDIKVDASIRNLRIIGEAASHIPESIKEKLLDVPWEKIKNLNHILAHEYFDVNPTMVWQTIQTELEPLKSNLQKFLEIRACRQIR